MGRFIGIDLAWNTNANHTGVAVLEGNDQGVDLVVLSKGQTTRVAVVKFVAEHLMPNTVIAIDASLVVPNKDGQRRCETQASRAFGQFGASCHSTNRRRKYWDAGDKLLKDLAIHGVQHSFDLAGARRRPGRWAFEVYPHPAMVRLFGLDRIITYKKGVVAERRRGLARLRSLIAKLPSLSISPALGSLFKEDVDVLKGEALKRYEDSLDAVFCGYLAWYCWRWGSQRNEMIGTLKEGYIVVPRAGE